SAERLTRNEKVVGSIPTGGSTQTPRSATRRRGAPWGAKIRRRCVVGGCWWVETGGVRRGRPRFLCGAGEPVGQHGGGGLPREPWIGAIEPERQTLNFSLPSPRRTPWLGSGWSRG